MTSLKRIVVTNWMMQGGGCAAPVIMLCYYSGQDVLEEYMDEERWSELKKTLEWEQLPIFTLEYEKGSLKKGTDDKMVLTNSIPTLRLIGQMFGYYFNNIDTKSRYDVDVWLELCSHCMKTLDPLLKDEEIKSLISNDGILYKWFGRFNRKLEKMYNIKKNIEKGYTKKSKCMFLVKGKISIADFNLFSTINSIVCSQGVNQKFLDNFQYLKKWNDEFLEHYKTVLESKPEKDKYPFIIHNNRYYVHGKDQTKYWGNEENRMSEDFMKDRNVTGVNSDAINSDAINSDAINIKMSSERYDELNKIKKEVQEEILTRESSLTDVENASIRVLKSTLTKHKKSFETVILKTQLISMVKECINKN